MSETDVKTVWTTACAQLQSLLHPDVFSRWIAVIEPESMEGTVLSLSVDNNFYQTWLEDNYLPLIRKAVATAAGCDLTIRFQVKHHPPAPPSDATLLLPSAVRRPARTSREAAALNPESSRLNPKFTFEEFIVGPSNSFAHAAAMAVAQTPARAYNPLFIYGGTGLGKTHLMQAIGHSVFQTSRAKVVYLSCEAFTNEYIENLKKGTLLSFRKKYRTVDVLLIDDIHFLGHKEGMQEEFFHTFNALHDARKQIVMNSDRPAAEIMGLEQRLVTRFEWGLVTEMQAPDLETRIAILRNKKEQGHLPVSDDVLHFIAQSVKSNIRTLEGALTRVCSYCALTNRDLTLPELENLLRDTLDKEKQQTLTFDMILRTVADHYDVRLSDMTSKRRPQSIAHPRQIAMYLCRTLTPASFPEIANVFGKTHATVLHACRVTERRMSGSPDLQREVLDLTRQLERRGK